MKANSFPVPFPSPLLKEPSPYPYVMMSTLLLVSGTTS